MFPLHKVFRFLIEAFIKIAGHSCDVNFAALSQKIKESEWKLQPLFTSGSKFSYLDIKLKARNL